VVRIFLGVSPVQCVRASRRRPLTDPFLCGSVRTRIVSLAAQKFIADIAHDALQQTKMRQAKEKKGGKDKRLVLTAQDLQNTLRVYGVHTIKPDNLGPAAPAAAGRHPPAQPGDRPHPAHAPHESKLSCSLHKRSQQAGRRRAPRGLGRGLGRRRARQRQPPGPSER